MSPRAGLDTETVVEAAAEMVDREGLAALTMAQLAKQLGIRTPSLYNHVDGLPGLHRALALRGLRALNEHLTRAAIGKMGSAAVMALADAFRGFVKDHPGLYAATVESVYLLRTSDEELHVENNRILDIVLAVLAPYGLTGEDALHAVRGLRSVVHGFATLELSGGFGMPLETDESFRRLVQMLIDSMGRHRQPDAA